MSRDVAIRRILLIGLLLGSFPAHAAFERGPLVPSAIALGRAVAAHGEARIAESINVAADETSGWIALAKTNPFRVEGLAEQSLHVGLPWRRAAFRLGWQRFGNPLHSEDTASLGVRLRHRDARVGIRGVYRARRTEGFAGADSLALDVGFLWRASPMTAFGASVRHLGERTFFTEPEWRLGVRIEVGDASTFLADLVRRDGVSGIAVGMEWRPSPMLTLRGGVHDRPWQWAGGFTLRWRRVGFDYAFETHPALETTHVVGFVVGTP